MKRLSILIAHEVPESCARLSWWLRSHHTACVHSARDAMSAARLLHFDVVVTALDISQRPHLMAIQGIKRDQPWLRLLAVLGESYPESRRTRATEAMLHGANAILFQPFNERQLWLALRACWNDDTPAERSPSLSSHWDHPSVSVLPQTPDPSP